MIFFIKFPFRLSYHGAEQQVYTVTYIPSKPGENVTYADLDTRYRPTQQGTEQDLRSTYAEISSKPMYV